MGHLFPLPHRSHLQDLLTTSSGQRRLLQSLRDRLLDSFPDRSTIDAFADDAELIRILRWCSDRICTVKELVDDPDLNFVWRKPRLDFGYEVVAASLSKSGVPSADAVKLVEDVKTVIQRNQDLTKLNGEIKKLTKGSDSVLPFKDLMGLTRWCLTGSSEGPPVFEVIDIVGKEKAVERLDLALEFLKERARLNESIGNRSEHLEHRQS